MPSYADDKVEEKRIVNEIAGEVAQAMGWEIEDDSTPLSDRAIIRKDTKSLYFHLDWRDKTRLNIGGGFEGCSQYLPYQDKREKTDITVSRDKPVGRIVKDIQNRLLPGYERMLAYALKMKTHDDEYKVKKQAELEEIAGFMSGAIIQDEKVYTYEPTNITCRWWSDSTWDLTARLTKDQLKKVLIVINEERKP